MTGNKNVQASTDYDYFLSRYNNQETNIGYSFTGVKSGRIVNCKQNIREIDIIM